MMKVKSFVVIMVIMSFMTLLVGTSMASGVCGPEGCPEGQYCCGKYGACSSGPSHCGGDEEAQAQPSTDLPETHKVDAEGGCVQDEDCPNGLCCSKYGYCGSGTAYCSGNVEQDEMYHPSTDPDLPQTHP